MELLRQTSRSYVSQDILIFLYFIDYSMYFGETRHNQLIHQLISSISAARYIKIKIDECVRVLIEAAE